ncbi:MAG: ABC-type transport auxiliary lipoprotein family protein [Gammaproteobacteria bacterium]
MRPQRIPLLVSLTAALCLAAGCGALKAPPRDTYYRLDIAAAPADTAASSNRVVVVPPLAASGLHGERALVMAHEDGTTLEQYNFHFWVDSPRIMIQQALGERIVAVTGARVIGQPAREASHTVRGRIVHFERFGRAKVRVALTFEVFGGRAAAPIFSRRYARDAEVGGDGVDAVARAISRVTGEILDEFADDLRDIL